MSGELACRLVGYIMLFVYLGVCFRVSTAKQTGPGYHQTRKQITAKFQLPETHKVKNPKSFAEELYLMNDPDMCDSPTIKHYFTLNTNSMPPSEALYLRKYWVQCLMHDLTRSSLATVRMRNMKQEKISANSSVGSRTPVTSVSAHCHDPLVLEYSRLNSSLFSPSEASFLKKFKLRCKVIEPYSHVEMMTKKEISKSNEKKLKKLRKLYESQCKPIKTYVPLEACEPSVQYIPRCAQVKRCGGCCADDRLECTPVGKIKTEKVSVQELTTLPNGKVKLAWKDIFVEKHAKCQCQCKTRKENCTRFQRFDPETCSCFCAAADKCVYPSQWDPVDCHCSCPRKLPCSSGYNFDHKTCKCVKSFKLGNV